jgi:hypothetical protein
LSRHGATFQLTVIIGNSYFFIIAAKETVARFLPSSSVGGG